jgi:hypothetical protein
MAIAFLFGAATMAIDGCVALPFTSGSGAYSRSALSVTDTLTGRFREAVSRYYLHPEVRLGANQELRLPGGEWIRWSVAGGEPRVVDSTWHPRFGASVPNRCIEVRFVSNELTVEFFWS